ncbi:putative fatty acyl-CoA reductase CG5065 [Pararge aegeria]|nr:putative fatty acyl-CoA reductase CG5065 [Pararge aegeria]
MPSLGITEYYAGKAIFITGATGFMGKVLVEKLLRSCPEVKTIYILVRTKKGQSPVARLDKFLKSRVFEKLQAIDPKACNKIRLVPGDILQENLGLSVKDEEELLRECQIVYNNAACVSFNLHIRLAVKMNTLGTQKVLKLAEKMTKLEVFVHVSTTFCHDDLDVVEEKLYPSKHNPQDIINMVDWMDDETLTALQPELIKPYPNTYGYSKCLTESLVSQYNGKFPIAIARPSIVVPSLKEPMPGWLDNINGPSGVVYAASRGVLRTIYCKDTTKLDTICVDLAINAIIILTFLTGIEKPKDIRVCNLSQYGVKDITWVECREHWSKYLSKYPLSLVLWYPSATAKNYKWEHKICEFFTHLVPAYLIDLLLFLLGKKTFMVRIIDRLTLGLEVLEYYNTRNWVFKNEYFKSLKHRITREEDETFFTDFSNADLDLYMENYVKGIREFYCKEDPSTIPQAKILHKRLYYLHVIVNIAFYALCVYFLYWIVKKVSLVV